MRSINPATEQLIREYPDHSPQQVQDVLRQTRAAFDQWRRLTVEDRCEALRPVATHLATRADKLCTLMTQEMGKPISGSRAEIDKCHLAIEYFIQHAPALLADQVIPTDASRSWIRYEPLGAVLAIMPWNFPFWQVFRAAIPALLAGNVIVLKHAWNVPGCAIAIESLFHDAGLAPGIFSSLLIDNDAAEALIGEDAIAAVTLTGSDRAGRAVGAAAGRGIKKCVLELGGSDPFIILDDVDIDSVAKSAAAARCINTGQSCIAAKRFLVDQKIAEPFEQAFARHMAALKIGDPMDPATQIGPLARLDLLENLHKQVWKSVDAGARLLVGGQRRPGKGFFYEPTVLTNVHPGMPAFDAETFGPVAAVTRFVKIEEAITLANRSVYGLGASIWTRNLVQAEHIAARLETGNVFINDQVKSDPRLPFGGVKQSGHGRELGEIGIKEFTNIKTVWIK